MLAFSLVVYIRALNILISKQVTYRRFHPLLRVSR